VKEICKNLPLLSWSVKIACFTFITNASWLLMMQKLICVRVAGWKKVVTFLSKFTKKPLEKDGAKTWNLKNFLCFWQKEKYKN
jgi:hypothetical protein